MQRFLIIGGLLLSGCLAIDTTGRPVSGVVLDAASGKPISDVSVFRRIDDKSGFVARTDASGRFAVSAAHTAYITIPMGDAFYRCSLIFRAPGYEQRELDCDTGVGASRTNPLSTLTVKLHKKT